MKKIYVIHSSGFDFEKELYKPLKKATEFEFIFPHARKNEFKNSKELIENCDLVLAEVSYPSTGSGIELGRAECFRMPIVAIFKKGSKISSSIKFLANDTVCYSDIEKDFEKIKQAMIACIK